MTSTLDMIRGRSNIVTLTNNSGGGLVAGDVCIQDTSADEKVTTTTSAASVSKVFIAAETIASGAAGKFYESGYCPLVNVNASVTRGRFLFTHTVAKQAAENATYGAGAFGKILKSGTTPSAIIYSATAQVAGAGTIGGATGSTDNAIIRADGTGGATVQSSLATVDDSGGVNIPTGQTYNINGSPHTHAGGSGATTYESAWASPPSTPAEGDQWLITNGFGLSARRGASAWSYYYRGNNVTIPPASSDGWTWVNQGASTAVDRGIVKIIGSSADTGDQLRGLVRAVTAPYTVVMMVSGFWPPSKAAAFGVWARQSSDGKLKVFYHQGNNANTYTLEKWNSPTSYASGAGTLGGAPGTAQQMLWPIYYLKIADNNTNFSMAVSPDSETWFTMWDEDRTTFATCDQAGFFTYSNGSGYNPIAYLIHWVVT